MYMRTFFGIHPQFSGIVVEAFLGSHPLCGLKQPIILRIFSPPAFDQAHDAWLRSSQREMCRRYTPNDLS